jgi:hypothetical protein
MEFGGLGILNKNNMAIALRLTWIWTRYQNTEGLWVDLIRAKYLEGRDVFSREVPSHDSQFWNAIEKMKWYFKFGAKHGACNGKKTFFLLDWWFRSGPL